MSAAGLRSSAGNLLEAAAIGVGLDHGGAFGGATGPRSVRQLATMRRRSMVRMPPASSVGGPAVSSAFSRSGEVLD